MVKTGQFYLTINTFGADSEFFQPMNIKERDNYIISIGYAKRDYTTLLKAWEKVSSLDTKLKIIGVNNLRKLGVSIPPSNVKLYDRVPINKLKELVAKSRFVIIPLPYYKYAYGQMTLLQSMSMRKAVIVTKTPSTIDYITDGKDALFVKLYDVNDMIQKIKFLLNNPSLVKRLGNQARETVVQRFNEKNMAQNINKFVKKIIRC